MADRVIFEKVMISKQHDRPVDIAIDNCKLDVSEYLTHTNYSIRKKCVLAVLESIIEEVKLMDVV